MVWIGNIYSIELGKQKYCRRFFGTVGEVIKGVEDPMSCAADPAKSMAPSMDFEALRAGSMAYSGTGNFSDVASIGCSVEMIGLQKAKGTGKCSDKKSWKYVCKKNNIGDNFSGFSEYINKYMHFVYALKERGIKLIPAKRLIFQSVYLY